MLDDSLQVLTEGYAWLPGRRAGRNTLRTRLGGVPAVGIEGPDAVRWFYDEDHVRRAGALPEPVSGTLFGKGSVHHLDGEAHRVRKAMFVALLMDEEGIDGVRRRAVEAWDDAVREWVAGGPIVLHEEAARVLARAVTRWAGIPHAALEVPGIAADLLAMVDGFASAGPRHWRARRARGRRERWLAGLVERVRAGTTAIRAGSALDVVAQHRDADGALLAPKTAAVELLNVIRPFTAVSWFLTFSGHALAHRPPLPGRADGGRRPRRARAAAGQARRPLSRPGPRHLAAPHPRAAAQRRRPRRPRGQARRLSTSGRGPGCSTPSRRVARVSAT